MGVIGATKLVENIYKYLWFNFIVGLSNMTTSDNNICLSIGLSVLLKLHEVDHRLIK